MPLTRWIILFRLLARYNKRHLTEAEQQQFNSTLQGCGHEKRQKEWENRRKVKAQAAEEKKNWKAEKEERRLADKAARKAWRSKKREHRKTVKAVKAASEV